jgi:hypothetical protein
MEGRIPPPRSGARRGPLSARRRGVPEQVLGGSSIMVLGKLCHVSTAREALLLSSQLRRPGRGFRQIAGAARERAPAGDRRA